MIEEILWTMFLVFDGFILGYGFCDYRRRRLTK